MEVYVFVETENGTAKQASLEALCYGRAVAESIGHKEVKAVLTSPLQSSEQLGGCGATELLSASPAPLPAPQAQAEVLAAVLPEEGNFTLIMARTVSNEQIAARLAVLQHAALSTGVTSLPEENEDGCLLQRSIYTGKAFERVQLKGKRRILCVRKNAVPFRQDSSAAAPKSTEITYSLSDMPLPIYLRQHKSTQAVPLPEADIVVSGGRGMKDPKNWHLLESLAAELGAATACSKPVSDMNWRPHHEHVGQTGIKIAPSLYIAVGISGAVQHLAGVNSSKVIVVINKDPEAPFFQAADYGIVGDAIEVLPMLTAAVKKIRV